MRTKFSRQTWTFDRNYTRVEALDDAGQPLGYVFFVRRTQRHEQAQSQPTLLGALPQFCRQWVSGWWSTLLAP